jgi:ribose-phosphate pyrophosphokinase
MSTLQLFAMDSSRSLGEHIARALDIPLSRYEEKEFEDGECKCRALDPVQGADVFVIDALHGGAGHSPNDRLVGLLLFLGGLADAAAARVTAVVPYLCYARQDRKTKANDPVATRHVARLFEAVGTQRIIALDVHNLAAFQNAFSIPTDHLEASALFVDYFASRLDGQEVVVVSPDAGGVKRAEQFRQALTLALGRPIDSAFVEKQRSDHGLGGTSVVGRFKGRTAIILDDMISTGATLQRAAQACRNLGAARIYAAATHAVLAGAAPRTLADPLLEHIVVTNSIVCTRPDMDVLLPKLAVLDAASLFAGAIRAAHGA